MHEVDKNIFHRPRDKHNTSELQLMSNATDGQSETRVRREKEKVTAIEQ